MRRRLLAQLGPARLVSSYQPHRRGYLVTARRTLAHMRQGLPKRWVRRVTDVHAPSGRYFLEPTSLLLRLCLDNDQPHLWWNERHQRGAETFFTPQRQDRIRRLPRHRSSATWSRGGGLLDSLALHLEGLAFTTQPEKHWRAVGDVFDDLWRKVRLWAVPTGPLAGACFSHLRLLASTLSAGHPDGMPERPTKEGGAPGADSAIVS